MVMLWVLCTDMIFILPAFNFRQLFVVDNENDILFYTQKFWKWSSCFNFTLYHTVIGPEYLHNFFNQSDLKLKPVVTWSLAFSCASISLLVFSVSSLRANYEILLSVHWLLITLGFTTLTQKALHHYLKSSRGNSL